MLLKVHHGVQCNINDFPYLKKECQVVLLSMQSKVKNVIAVRVNVIETHTNNSDMLEG